MTFFLKGFSFIFVLLAAFIFYKVPSEKKLKGCFTTTMYDVELCPGSKNYVKLNQVSTYLQKAIVSTEDSKFYQHNGFDSEGIEHCIEKIKEKKRFVCGGSTITQQLAKNLFLSKNKSLLRKGMEALITVKIEKDLTKKEILEKYLNVVQFGKNIFGVKQAAYHYFKKTPAQLDVVESAFLAMVLPNPEKYSASYYRKDLTKFARRRITRIIENMHQFKMISDEPYYTGLARIDSFLVSGQKNSSSQTEELSTDDLDEMNED